MASEPLQAASPVAPAVRRPKGPARPILKGVGLDGPFFEDKNRAFWILQSIGWAGYFVLRTLSRHRQCDGLRSSSSTPLLLTATGYSITLLMASLYRRLIGMRPI